MGGEDGVEAGRVAPAVPRPAGPAVAVVADDLNDVTGTAAAGGNATGGTAAGAAEPGDAGTGGETGVTTARGGVSLNRVAREMVRGGGKCQYLIPAAAPADHHPGDTRGGDFKDVEGDPSPDDGTPTA